MRTYVRYVSGVREGESAPAEGSVIPEQEFHEIVSGRLAPSQDDDLPLREGSFPNAVSGRASDRRATTRCRARYRLAREAAYAAGREEFAELAMDATFRDFVCMYIGEGYKRNRNEVSLGNSDPAVVKLAARWMCHFARNPVKYSVQYHADQRLEELTAFWARTLATPTPAPSGCNGSPTAID